MGSSSHKKCTLLTSHFLDEAKKKSPRTSTVAHSFHAIQTAPHHLKMPQTTFTELLQTASKPLQNRSRPPQAAPSRSQPHQAARNRSKTSPKPLQTAPNRPKRPQPAPNYPTLPRIDPNYSKPGKTISNRSKPIATASNHWKPLQTVPNRPSTVRKRLKLLKNGSNLGQPRSTLL